MGGLWGMGGNIYPLFSRSVDRLLVDDAINSLCSRWVELFDALEMTASTNKNSIKVTLGSSREKETQVIRQIMT